MRRIAIVGASGLVGSTLTERLASRGTDEIVPFVHSSGNALRLARLGIKLCMLDLTDPAQVDAALAGCTHVVNCSRGDDELMITGLKHLLAASKKHRVHRVVHLSSVAVYGDPPPPESATENAPAQPEKGSYGWIKLRQDRIVQGAAQAGMPAVILCPPNISGPYSYFLVNLVDALRSGAFALLEDGGAPCNLVDVGNLCHAIDLALERGPSDGQRMFVTDDADSTWRAVVDALVPLAETAPPKQVTRAQLSASYSPPGRRTPSLIASIKHLVSSDVRSALRKDPIWEKADVAARRLVAKCGTKIEGRLRLSVEGPVTVRKAVDSPAWATPLSRQQLREVRHSCALAKARLGYAPVYSAEHSMRAFRNWYRVSYGMDSADWPLLRELGR